jgi:prepilin-type N-terminal cleavage/methylation domain-containing protein
MKKLNSSKGFTLIELLVVIAIIAILAVVVVLTLNPAQLLAQSRDSNRISDFATLKSAIALYQADVSSTNMGSSSVLYVGGATLTLTNVTGTTQSGQYWDIVTAISIAATTTRGTGGAGSGWLPINFSNISSGAPFSLLPVDPLGTGSNTTCAISTAPCVYTYITDGTNYKLASKMESAKYNYLGGSDVVSTDGGPSTSTFEAGTKLTL